MKAQVFKYETWKSEELVGQFDTISEARLYAERATREAMDEELRDIGREELGHEERKNRIEAARENPRVEFRAVKGAPRPLRLQLQHEETGRLLDWPSDRPIPPGYAICSWPHAGGQPGYLGRGASAAERENSTTNV